MEIFLIVEAAVIIYLWYRLNEISKELKKRDSSDTAPDALTNATKGALRLIQDVASECQLIEKDISWIKKTYNWNFNVVAEGFKQTGLVEVSLEDPDLSREVSERLEQKKKLEESKKK